MDKETRPVQTQRQRTPDRHSSQMRVSPAAQRTPRPTGQRTQSRVPAQQRSLDKQRELAKRKKAVHRHAVREPHFVTVRKKRQDRAPFPIGMVAILVLITAMFLFMMMNYAQIDQYNGSIRELQDEVAALQAEQKKLDVRLENKNDRAAFEAFATERLGMVKSDSLNKFMITLSPQDKTEIMQYEQEEKEGFGYLFSGLAEVVRNFFG